MRRQFLGALLFAGTLAFTACQNETVIYLDENGNPIENVELKEGEGLLKINLSNTSADSRAARPVGSSAAANNVNTVKVYVYSSTTDGTSYALDTNVSLKGEQDNISMSNGVITITSYNGEVEHTNDTDVNHAVATIKLTGLTAGNYYKFLAVGYNVASAGGDNPYGIVANFTSFSATTTTEKTGHDVEELFAGVTATATQATEKANFATTPTVNMERQVAGMLGYFENIPTNINGTVVKFVKVYANKGFKKFKYPSLEDFNGDVSSAIVENDGKTELLSFNMETIATNWNSDSPEEGNYTFADCSSSGLSADATASKTAPLATDYKAPAGLKLKEGSIFGGCYIIPYDKHYDAQTLTVELQDASEKTLKTLNVTTTQKPADVSGGSFDGAHAYDIRRNNFYSIGKKLYTDNTGGDPDPDPTPDPVDPDEPIDLGGGTEIIVLINDAWKVLHNMGVEE